MRSQPERAEQSLRAIGRAGREGLTEMRRLLGLMADDRDAAERSPQPTIHSVEGPDRRSAPSRLDVGLEAEGEPRAVAPAVDLSAYRIVQEALTNVIRHAHAGAVHITARERGRILTVTIKDNGRGITKNERQSAESIGLLGMTERARLLGGAVVIKGVAGRGTTVTLRVPLHTPR